MTEGYRGRVPFMTEGYRGREGGREMEDTVLLISTRIWNPLEP
jgi:hypothetical protein